MEYKYFKECQPERNIQGNFASGQINFKFSLDECTKWCPCKSFIKIKMKISKGDGSRLDRVFGLAPNMFICDNLFQQMNMRINGTSVSHCNDYVAQCAALKYRLNKDMNKRESIMSSINYSQINLYDRINAVSSDGIDYNIKEEAEKPSTLQTSTVQIIGETTINAAQITILGIRADATQIAAIAQANHGRATSDINVFQAGDLPVGAVFRQGGVDYTVQVITDAQNAFVTPVPASDVNAAGISIINSETTRRNLIGTNTNFNTSSLVVGDELEIDGKRGFFIEVITDATNLILKDLPNLTAIPATADWKVIKRKVSQRANDIELIWRPSLGFFDIKQELCSGNYHLELTPHTDGTWQKYAVESLTDLLVSETAATGFKIEISEMNMYLWSSVYSSPRSKSISLGYTDITCNTKNLTTASLALQTFHVSPNNHSLTLAFQDAGVGDNTTLSRSKFKVSENVQEDLTRFYIKKNNITLPDPIPTLSKIFTSGINHITQRYYENFAYQEEEKGELLRCEDLQDYFDAGPYYHYKWGKGTSQTPQVDIYSNFTSSANFTNNKPNMLLFDHYYRSVQLDVSNGRITGVSTK